MNILNKKTIDDLNVNSKRVLLRCDFNVPLKSGVITDENRIMAAIPTIKKLLEDGSKLILCSHLGKPKGEPKPELSLLPVAKRLSEILNKTVVFESDAMVVSDKIKSLVDNMKSGDILLLENTRYRAEETKNGEAFSKQLGELADIFVNDAFGAAHRAHCSTVGVGAYVEESAIGYLIEKELKYLGGAIKNPKRPFVTILGGAKVADKLTVIENLIDKADTIIIGGGMAYTFLAAKGYEVGTSLLDSEKIDYCKDMLKKAESNNVKILLPIDCTIAKSFPNPIDAEIDVQNVDANKIPADYMGLDIGEKTSELFAEAVAFAKTVVWNGPMGVFENPILAKGTIAVAKSLAKTDAITIIGGGDSAAAVNILGYGDKMSHISTGGGASLEFLEGKDLPGIISVNDK